MPTTPQAWADLLEALNLLSTHPNGDTGPFYCSHDTLYVTADDKAFKPEELTRLSALGFEVHRDGGFYSYRFGSA